jgi:hypothetical protein
MLTILWHDPCGYELILDTYSVNYYLTTDWCPCQNAVRDAISDYVILRDPCHNEFEVRVVRESGVVYFGDGWHSLKDAYDIRFGAWVTLTYVSPILLAIRVLSRWCIEVGYPNYDPPLRHLLARSDPRCKIGSSVVNICSPGSSRPKTLIRSYVKDLTLYDIHSGVLVIYEICIFEKFFFLYLL